MKHRYNTITRRQALKTFIIAALGTGLALPLAALGADYTVIFDHAAGIHMESGLVRTDAPSLAKTSLTINDRVTSRVWIRKLSGKEATL